MQKTPEKHIQIRSSKLMNSMLVGNFKAAFAGKGLEFQDFREYTPGDDAKYIDWLTSSREGTIVMRRYKEEKQANILCILDVSESLFFDLEGEKIQQIDELLEFLARLSLLSGEAFGGYIYGSEKVTRVNPKKSMRNLFELKKYKNLIPRGQREKMNFQNILHIQEKKSILFFISDSLEVDERYFKALCLKHDIVYIHISSLFENTLEGTGVRHIRAQKISFGINLDDKHTRDIYQKKRKEKLAKFETHIRSLGADIMFLDPRQSLFVEFLKLMKRREY